MKIIQAVKYFLIIASGILLGLLACEVALRLNPKYRPAAMINFNVVKDNCDWSKRYRPSKLFGYELIPNASPDINSFGMRDKEYTLKKSLNTYRILLLGDSITENGLWSDYVEDMLNKGGRYEILNCAVMGWGLYNYWLYLREKGAVYGQDMVLIGFCLNDIDESDNIQTIYCDKTNNKTYFYYVNFNNLNRYDLTLSINPYLYMKSYLYRFFTVNFISKMANRRHDDGISPEMKLREMKSRSHGKILGIIYPYLKPLNSYTANELNEYTRTKDILNKLGIEYLDLMPYFQKYGDKITTFRKNSSDQIHFNDDANRIKASIIFPWLLKEIHKFK